MFRITSVLAGTILALSTTSAAQAQGAVHDEWAEQWQGTQEFTAGEGPCVDWAGTLHEVRSGSYRLLTAPGGVVEDEFHVNGMVDGHIDLVPHEPAQPTYSGDFREKVNAVITGFDEETGDLARVVQYRLRVPLHGTDGSSVVLLMSGKVTVDAGGTMRVARDRYECVAR